MTSGAVKVFSVTIPFTGWPILNWAIFLGPAVNVMQRRIAVYDFEFLIHHHSADMRRVLATLLVNRRGFRRRSEGIFLHPFFHIDEYVLKIPAFRHNLLSAYRILVERDAVRIRVHLDHGRRRSGSFERHLSVYIRGACCRVESGGRRQRLRPARPTARASSFLPQAAANASARHATNTSSLEFFTETSWKHKVVEFYESCVFLNWTQRLK